MAKKGSKNPLGISKLPSKQEALEKIRQDLEDLKEMDEEIDMEVRELNKKSFYD